MKTYIRREVFVLSLTFLTIFTIVFSTVWIWISVKPDYQGVLTDLTEDTFIVEPNQNNPEAEYATYLIHYESKTNVNGKGEELAEGQIIKVWGSGQKDKFFADNVKITRGVE